MQSIEPTAPRPPPNEDESLTPSAPVAPPTDRVEPRTPGPVVVFVFALAAITVLGAMALIWARRPSHPDFPVLATLQPFDLVNQRGRPTHLSDFAGKVWVADFIFTSCPTECPKLTARMRELQDHLIEVERRAGDRGRAVRLVSFSVDPETDTPARLLEYAKRFGADESRWTFLTGPLDEVTRAVEKGLKIPFERTGTNAFDIMHGEQFVLVDAQGRIRGYFDVHAGLRAIEAAVDELAHEKGP